MKCDASTEKSQITFLVIISERRFPGGEPKKWRATKSKERRENRSDLVIEIYVLLGHGVSWLAGAGSLSLDVDVDIDLDWKTTGFLYIICMYIHGVDSVQFNSISIRK